MGGTSDSGHEGKIAVSLIEQRVKLHDDVVLASVPEPGDLAEPN
jgi:hypothetical protein